MTDLADRYGTSRRGRGPVIVVAGALAVLFLGWLAWTTWSYSRPDVTSELLTWQVTGEHGAVANVQVALRADDTTATCTLRATAEDHSVVGERSFEVAPDSASSLQVQVRTERRATAVELVGCTTPGQSRPR